MKKKKPEFWETAFAEKQEMWGLAPVNSVKIALETFKENNVQHVLIPGFGYGRNAQPFINAGMHVTGIEISQTAIEMANKHFGNATPVFHGSVTEMPFDTKKYDGIFCYALIHLLNQKERRKLILDCYNQLEESGIMIFSVVSKKAETYGTGKYISKDRYAHFGGVNLYFYDEDSIQNEFGKFGLENIQEITENYPFFVIVCRK